ncbi:MAG: hypothetical protein IKC32_05230, partial [Clostridia bacterium]|nr:hypothetical protein [Clostridia bacterium]
TSSTRLVSYTYDAWGRIQSNYCSNGGANTSAVYNPFRYRGYYYDDDLDLYYLATRYYDPEVRRFVTQDSYVSTGQGILGHNRFAYCGNNPVMRTDFTGESWEEFWADLGDFAVTAFAATYAAGNGLSHGCYVAITTGDSTQGFVAGVSRTMHVNGLINNGVNALYYNSSTREFHLDESGNISAYASDDGSFTYINRWDRLDHARYMTQGEPYFGGGWEYYAEYSVHMYGWGLMGWASNKDVPLFTGLANRAKYAEIGNSLEAEDSWYVRAVCRLYWKIMGELIMKGIITLVLIISMLLFVSCGEFHRTGDLDYYYEEGRYLSDFETTRDYVYSVYFVKKFETIDFCFHYYLAPASFWSPLGKYDISVSNITYSSENYELAKQDLFENTEYVSEAPNYVYNDYDFYRVEPRNEPERNVFRYFNAFSDTKNTIVLMGIWISTESNINLDVPEDEWPEFLRTYFGEYYDFDA